MAKGVKIKWLKDPEDHDYPAAGSYLELLYDKPLTASVVKRLRRAPMVEFKAKVQDQRAPFRCSVSPDSGSRSPDPLPRGNAK